ncbi:unnamed protein product [Linum trigynum]|uniref:Uncharacterized protein n=1 Tax=Linum trigynum TaxID=586398 RepID=A0AAV2FBL6_9ROSI
MWYLSTPPSSATSVVATVSHRRTFSGFGDGNLLSPQSSTCVWSEVMEMGGCESGNEMERNEREGQKVWDLGGQ